MAFYGAAPIIFESVSAVTATNSVELGTRRTESGEDYVYCYNDTGSAVTQGALMIQSGSSGYSLTRSTTASSDMPICAVKHAAVPAGSYFWGLTRGSVRLMSFAVTKGDLIGCGVAGIGSTYLAAVTSVSGPLIGKALDTATSGTQPLVSVRLWG